MHDTDPATDDDLPGMWSRADYTGGDSDDRSYAERERAAETKRREPSNYAAAEATLRAVVAERGPVDSAAAVIEAVRRSGVQVELVRHALQTLVGQRRLLLGDDLLLRSADEADLPRGTRERTEAVGQLLGAVMTARIALCQPAAEITPEMAALAVGSLDLAVSRLLAALPVSEWPDEADEWTVVHTGGAS